MIRRSVYRLASVASILFLFAAAAEAAVQYRIDDAALAPLSAPTKIGAKLKISKVPLVDGEEAELELERFEVWADNAEIKVFGANQEVVELLPRPDAKYYRGRVAGKPESLVFISVMGRRVDGLVYVDDRKFALGSERRARGSEEMNLVVQESSVMDDIPLDGRGFECGVEKMQLNTGVRPRAVTNALGEPVSNAAPAGTQRSVINLAIDTDYELFDKAGDTAANVSTYIGNLIGAVSTIYERDLRTEVRIAYVGVQSSSSDPFLIVPGVNGTTLDALLELGDRWHNSPPSANARSAATLISGKNQLAGIAWVGTLCSSDFAYDGHWGGKYSYNGGITPPSNLSVPDPDANLNYTAPSSNYWPLLEVAHELGHNVGSDHTHCISLSAAQKTEYAVTRNYVDECYNAEGGCFSGTMLVPAEKGTIMSYCHLRGPGYGTNTRFTFGQDGESSEVALNGLVTDMANHTPAMSAITVPGSLSVGQTGTASVVNAGLTYSWTITNGTFTGGVATAAGASVSFSGTVSPVSLTVTATNASGCSVTDTATVQLASVALTAPANFSATAVGSTSVALSWLAVANASGYEIFRSTSGLNFVSIGTSDVTSYTDLSVAPGTAYLYRVRATQGGTTGPYSASDSTAAVVFAETITAGVTRIKSSHFTELLSAVNALRALAGLGSISFTSPAPSSITTIRAAHVSTLRTGVTQAYASLGLSSPVFTDATLTTQSTVVKAVHLNQLRTAVR